MITEISTNTTPARGLALATFDDAWRFWQMVAKTDFAPKDFKNKPESCMLAGQHGAELGLGPMQSLQCIAVINGRPTIWGDAALALVQSSPVCEFVSETVEGDGDQMVATCVAKRRGYPAPSAVKFSVADAKKAGLWGKSGPWSQYPKRMLQLRARGFALRDAFPDVLRGLVTAEEAQDYPQATEPPRPVVVQQQPPNATVEAHIKKPTQPQDTPEGKAKLAIGRATTLAELDKLRRRLDECAAEGTFTTPVHAELVSLCQTRAEMLIADDERGQEFAHEAAEHEVTA